MKISKLIGIIVFAVIIALTMAVCDDEKIDDLLDSSNQNTVHTFSNVADFAAWLYSQPANTKDKPYFIALNIGDERDFTTLNGSLRNENKYISLDLSGSTITSIRINAFSNCISLTSVTIPDSVTNIEYCAFINCSNLTSVTIPDSVTTIGGSAFYGCASLTSVTIPNSVTTIGYETFAYCTKLTSVTIPNSVTTIWGNAFSGCTSLTSVTIPDSVTSIGEYAFRDCTGLTTVTIGNSVTGINQSTFYGCTSLANVTIGNSVTTIGWDAFSNCTSLISITIPDSVTDIKERAFSDCTSLTSIATASGNPNYASERGILYNKAKTEIVVVPKGISGNVTIPNSVTSIGYYIFSNCYSLTSVTIPDSVTSIGSSAFSGCTSLTSITFEGTIPSSGIYSLPFDGDLRAKFYEIDRYNGTPGTYTTTAPVDNSSVWTRKSDNDPTQTADGFYVFTSVADFAAWFDSQPANTKDNPYLIALNIGENDFTTHSQFIKNKLINNADKYVFLNLSGSTISIIPYEAFGNCTTLTGVTVPNSVTNIKYYAFSGCTSLTSITIPNNVTSIESNTFSGCTSLTNVTIGNSVTSIESNAFSGCTSLTSVTMPNSVISIEGGYYGGAFWGCTSLTSVTIPNSVTSIENNAFSGCVSLRNITIKTDKVTNTYTNNWGTIFPAANLNITFQDITSIGDYAFYNCTRLISVTIPNSVTTIGSSAFSGCTGITSVTIPNSVTNIERSAFSGCTSLTSVTIPNSVTSIEGGDYYGGAFWGCTSLTSVTIGNSVTSISSYTFSDCTSLTSVTIGKSVTSIGNDAFASCENLASVTIPSSVTSIGNYAFQGCTTLRNITIKTDKVTNTYTNNWGHRFSASNLNVTFQDITSIGEYAFSGCTSLTSITISNSVTTIESGAFGGCTGLTSVTIPNSVTSVERQAFAACTNLIRITIPNSVTSIESGAFLGCTNLAYVTFEGTIPSSGFDADAFQGDLKSKFYATNSTNGTPRMYTTTTPVNNSSTWTGTDGIPTAADFYIGKLSQIKDNGIVAVTITPFSGKSNGAITIYYNGLTTLPTNVGSYAVTFDVAAKDDWKAANGLSAGTLTITEYPTPTAADFNIGNLSQIKNNGITSVTITPKPDKSSGAVTIYYVGTGGTTYAKSTTLPTNIGSYAVTFDVAAASGWKAANGLSAGTFTIRLLYVSELSAYLSGKPFNNKENSYSIEINIDENDFTALRTTLRNNSNKYVYLDLSGSNITTIPENAFYVTALPYGCATLTGITIPNSVTSIGNYAFAYCENLTGITIPNSVTSIGDYAFNSCDNLTSVTIGNGVINIGDYAFNSCDNLTSVTIGNKVTGIGNYAFTNCTSLTGVIIPNSVTNIGTLSFGNSGLTSVTIPGSLTSIGTGAFAKCTNLTSINVDIGNSVYTAENGVLYNKDKTTLVVYPAGKTTFNISDSVTIIGSYAASACTKLSGALTIPNGVTSIGEGSFFDCYNISSVTIPNSVTSIGASVFGIIIGINTVTFQGTIPSSGFSTSAFPDNLRAKFYEKDPTNGTRGTYWRNPDSTWGTM